ncbi:nodulation protein NodN [Sphingomonas spermidinifaciens]|uniref:Nodulation protein NodN n=1 Tax=Sphingomonas spermidinifaciens TaxID=1141889 RepID=A0A2A4B4L0_9SPHN|nr:MaoC family dehydratase [Sphingomonas spermidinifaciens]PCD02604.1 nodulation protein NodN [Sphingomonas spermidinifaciens]
MPVAIEQRAKEVGTVRTSDWVRVDQAMIDAFAEATGDRQFIHIDPERAAQTPFGGTIAHGFLTLSLMPLLAERTEGLDMAGAKMGVNYGGNRVRFLTPVRSGSRVRGHFKLLELTEKRRGQWQQTTEFTVEIEGEGKPALIAEWISHIFV